MVPVGLFEGEHDLVFESQVFIDEKPSYYRFADQTDNMTGAAVFAKYGAPES